MLYPFIILTAIIILSGIVGFCWKREGKTVDVMGNDCQASDRVGKFVEQYKMRNRI